jgi:purine-cytosine permease-like protein
MAGTVRESDESCPRAGSALAFWWGGNVNVFDVVLGAVLVSIGLRFWWALIAIVAGTLTGALLIALHATQGPKLGVPQTIQSRAQFGFYGSAFLFPAVLLINVGFIAAQLVIQAQAMQGVTGSVTIAQWILILTVPTVVTGIFGYRWIHRVMQATAVVVGVSLVIMLVQGLRYGSLPAPSCSSPGWRLLVIGMLSFGPAPATPRARATPTCAATSARSPWARPAPTLRWWLVLAVAGCGARGFLAALVPEVGRG